MHGSPRPRRRLGLALGGGAVRGAAHIGVLRVLEREGIEVDVVVGTSVGALVGAGHAAGLTPTEMSEIARGVRARDRARIGLLRSRISLLETPSFLATVEDRLGDRWIEDLDPRFGATTCDLRTGEPVCITAGSIGPALRASTAVPGIFPPVRVAVVGCSWTAASARMSPSQRHANSARNS